LRPIRPSHRLYLSGPYIALITYFHLELPNNFAHIAYFDPFPASSAILSLPNSSSLITELTTAKTVNLFDLRLMISLWFSNLIFWFITIYNFVFANEMLDIKSQMKINTFDQHPYNL